MDMNEILEKWDDFQKKEKQKQKEISKIQVSHKKANAPSKEEKSLLQNKNKDFQIQKENSKKINPMELYLRRYGTIDKDKIMQEQNEHKKFQNREYLVQMKCEATIDLHGLRFQEALERLTTFVDDCHRRGLKKILIIHGKGIHTKGSDPVLGKLVKSFIETNKFCGLSGHPKTKSEGSTGATWVILKYKD